MLFAIPPLEDLDITFVFIDLWRWLKDVYVWMDSSYIVILYHRVSYAKLAIFGMALGILLSKSRFAKILGDSDEEEEAEAMADDMTFNPYNY